MSDADSSPTQPGVESAAPETVDAYWLVGEQLVILGREWTHGEQSGWTAERVLVRVDGYSNFGEIESESQVMFPEVSSENISRMLANGELQQIPHPFPIPTPLRACLGNVRHGASLDLHE